MSSFESEAACGRVFFQLAVDLQLPDKRFGIAYTRSRQILPEFVTIATDLRMQRHAIIPRLAIKDCRGLLVPFAVALMEEVSQDDESLPTDMLPNRRGRSTD